MCQHASTVHKMDRGIISEWKQVWHHSINVWQLTSVVIETQSTTSSLVGASLKILYTYPVRLGSQRPCTGGTIHGSMQFYMHSGWFREFSFSKESMWVASSHQLSMDSWFNMPVNVLASFMYVYAASTEATFTKPALAVAVTSGSDWATLKTQKRNNNEEACKPGWSVLNGKPVDEPFHSGLL